MNSDDPMSDTNLNPSEIDPELLSAFYDGETSSAERAHIEQLMDESPDALQALDDYDQLTQSLRQLHQATPSPDLREAVMARIGSTAAPGRTSAAPAGSRRIRMLSVAASLAVAVLVMLLVWPDGPGVRLGDVGQGLAINEAAQSAEDFDDASLTETARLPDIASARAGRPASEAAAAMDATPTAPATLAEMEETIDNALSLAELAQNKPALEPGDVIEYLTGNADELTLVMVTVVDVQSAGNQVQLLLSQHGVQSPVQVDSLKQERQQSEDQFLILVEADWNQLGAVIVDLNDRSFVNAMQVDAAPEDGVPALLQGFRMARNRESGQPESNKDIGPLRQQAQSLAAGSAALSGRIGEAAGGQANQSKGHLIPSSIQLPAAVSDEAWQRLAAHRSIQAEELPDPASDPPAAAEPGAADETTSSPRSAIGAPLARPLPKTVFVIQKSDE